MHAFERFGYRIGSRGTRSEEMIPVVRAGRLGEGWLSAQNASDAALAEQLELYRRTAAAHGPPCRAVLRRDVFSAESDDAARAPVEPILEQGYRGVDYERLLVGSPGTVVGRLRQYESMGFDHVMARHITGDHEAINGVALLGDVVAAVA